ncbi:hypothetical protein GGS23DRAFT_35780 [Durotheca rogersii]|uniref:uncharacterized protein n=1 Tax=Durotheca rogersii TaxID=419775 RepID=UPI002220439E|nr:uncharacterized protein GGS23DRAFT_35780 [Durotheca rogersii]KAI5868540.1 hypothetical protein GGS23DRAFT_35780 [Durotheca rogersii]
MYMKSRPIYYAIFPCCMSLRRYYLHRCPGVVAQGQTNMQFMGMHGYICQCPPLPTSVPPLAVTPSKRSDDDEVQFISSQPVKRRKISQQRSSPIPHQPVIPTIPTAPLSPSTPASTEPKEADRRVSTGMVGLPSDFSAMELTCALRGVSLPALEKFTFNQPFRRQRPLSPPELSPKQLPPTIASEMLSFDGRENHAGVPGYHMAPVACMTADERLGGPEMIIPSSLDAGLPTDQLYALNTSAIQARTLPPMRAEQQRADPKSAAMPPPPVPKAGYSATPESSRPVHHTARHRTTRQPCQVCSKMRQQVTHAKTQGVPMMHSGVAHPTVQHMPCHQPYNPHFHSHTMALAPTNNMHTFSPSFAPMMMPISSSSRFAASPPRTSGPTRQMDTGQQSARIASPQHAPENSAATKPAKPAAAAALIPPTYRKPSPNLIVDVAETCQERFPFEEVARRHGVAVEKVLEVFAAIIQVPLLRCPTDRRRAGKLATARVREYNKAKRAIREERGAEKEDGTKGKGKGKGGAPGDQAHPRARGDQIAVEPADVARHLGPMDLPEEFEVGGL